MENGKSSELLLAVNDRTFNTLWALGAEQGDFACECGHTDCSERLGRTLIQYAAREEGQALLAHGHEVVERETPIIRASP